MELTLMVKVIRLIGYDKWDKVEHETFIIEVENRKIVGLYPDYFAWEDGANYIEDWDVKLSLDFGEQS